MARIPGKHAGPATRYAIVQVVIPDQPGELARLFQAAGEAGVNIEDIRIEHSPGLPSGVAELAVKPPAAGPLRRRALAARWLAGRDSRVPPESRQPTYPHAGTESPAAGRSGPAAPVASLRGRLPCHRGGRTLRLRQIERRARGTPKRSACVTWTPVPCTGR